MIDVILGFDYDGILGATLFIGFAILIINITIDILQAFIDPRTVDIL
jgi:ABC-type dipeptide/oligopeptide/nickel transport system permease component